MYILIDDNNVIKDYNRIYEEYNNCVIVKNANDDIVLIYPQSEDEDLTIVSIEDEIEDFIGNKFIWKNGKAELNPEFEEEE